jgi:hypothetical protein
MNTTFLLRAAILSSVMILPTARATDYYFSPSGSDANAGTSAAQAFGSLDKLNSLDLKSGDKVLLQGGASFTGNINLNSADTATSASGAALGAPIKISTYGKGLATINAGDGSGISATNNGNIEISNLNLVGSGDRYDSAAGKYVFDNKGSGVEFRNDASGTRENHVVIKNVTTSGFGRYGVLLGASGTAGYNDVKITNVTAHDNKIAGIATFGDQDHGNRNNFSNVTIAKSKAYNNPGEDKDPAGGNSGNGIVIGQVTNGVIENSVAHDNGTRCASTSGGAVGIWTWDSANVTIQKNESYRNGTAGTHDGGGFDLDGGVINSVMQYNYSHDNAGAGYLLAEYPGAKKFSGNTVKFNVSEDDARENGYGAIHAFSSINDTNVHNNTVVVSPAEKEDLSADGAPPVAVKFRDWTGQDLKFFDNLLVVKKDSNADSADPRMLAINDGKGLDFQDNAYGEIAADASVSSLSALYRDANDDSNRTNTASRRRS